MLKNIIFRVEIFEEEGRYVSLCPELNVSSFGDTIEEAKKSIKEAVELFIEECKELGTLQEVLEESGFHKVNKPQEGWVTREPIIAEKLGMVKKVWIRGDRKDFYEAELDFDKIIKSGLVGAAETRMKIILETITETENLVKEASLNLNEEKKTQELYLKRLKGAKEIYKFAERILNNIFSGKLKIYRIED